MNLNRKGLHEKHAVATREPSKRLREGNGVPVLN
jgi:hypothetical protein